MEFFGLKLPFGTRQKARTLSSVGEGRGWFRVFESSAGAWQKGIKVDRDTAMTFHAVYACVTLIASDIAKLPIKLVQKQPDGTWLMVTNPAYSPVLRKPNDYQTRMQFIEGWVLSKVTRGNTYVLKQRDGRGVVVKLHVLDPGRVKPLIAEDGSVFYDLQSDDLSGVKQNVIVPAREIIHDRFNCLFHPLVGTSPIYASGLAVMQGLNIQTNSAAFFGNNSQPGGVLTAPGEISNELAERMQAQWNQNYSGKNAGKVAVLGDGLKYERMALTAEEAQLIDQLKWTAEVVASTYHVPLYKIGVGQMPTVNNVQSLNTEYYMQCLQSLIEALEACLDDGLGTGENLGTEFDVDNLLRMDSTTQMTMLKQADGILTPNEQRLILNKPPVSGGNSVYKQQQDYSLEALAKRDAQADPFGTEPAPVAAPAPKSLSAAYVKKLFAKEAA